MNIKWNPVIFSQLIDDWFGMYPKEKRNTVCANSLNLPVRYIQRWRTNNSPRFEYLLRIMKFFGISNPYVFGMHPSHRICMYCNKIMGEKHTSTGEDSHGICPDCKKIIDKEIKEGN